MHTSNDDVRESGQHDDTIVQPDNTEVRLGNALAAVATSLRLLCTGPVPLSADGTQIGYGLPPRDIPLTELRDILLRPTTGYVARDAAWRHVVARSRQEGGAWTVGAVGLALPGLWAIVDRLTRGGAVGGSRIDELATDLVSGFVFALARLDIDQPRVAARLIWSARKYAMRASRSPAAEVAFSVEKVESMAPRPPWGHVDLLLADAVAQHLITPLEAKVIGASRFEDLDLHELAAHLQVSYWALAKARRRAELRLAAAIIDGRVRTHLSGWVSNIGD